MITGLLDMVCTAGEKVLEITDQDPPTNPNALPARVGEAEFLKRSAESARIRQRYPGRIPVVIIMHGKLVIDRPKFLVPVDLTWGQLMYVVRKRLNTTNPNQISPGETLYGMVNRTMIPSETLVSFVAETDTHADGMLYVHVYRENTFGNTVG